MQKKYFILLALIILSAVALLSVSKRNSISPAYADNSQKESTNVSLDEKKEYYTCPMHPSVRKDGPGACPICGMTLVKTSAAVENAQEQSTQASEIFISPSRQVLANVATVKPERKALIKSIQAAGTIAYAEPSFNQISIRFPARLEKLYLNYEGETVRAGDPVADVYSPELISARKEYLLAKEAYKADSTSGSSRTLFDQSRNKLLLLGIDDAEIGSLDMRGGLKPTVTIHSPVSGTVLKKYVISQQYVSSGENLYDIADLSLVWLYADIYQFEMGNLKAGQAFEMTSDAYPGRVFSGKISFISPTVDPSTRSVRIRADIPNRSNELKVGMFVNVSVHIELPAQLVVPYSAVIQTGKREIIWVEKKPGVFQPKIVKTGIRAGDEVQILEGLKEGEIIASSGGYLIDSESQLEASTQ